MNLVPLWYRYFLKEIFKVFFLFLFSFYFVYVLLDYSTHMQDFIKEKEIQVSQFLTYYGYQFIKRSNLLLPLALLVSTIKVLTTMNSHRELVALQASGLSAKKLTQPFFLIAGICTLFNAVSAEFLLPQALNKIDHFHYAHFKHSSKHAWKEPIHVLALKDNSKLIYQTYDPTKELFFDVIWIRSNDDLWRIKYLKVAPDQCRGHFVDHLTRNAQGLFEKEESFETCVLDEIKWHKKLPPKGILPIENYKVSSLYRLSFGRDAASSYEKSELTSQLYMKCLIPFSPFLAITAVAPYCIRYSRRLKIFLLYTAGIFGLIAFYTLMDAAVIIGENHVVPPFWAIFAPFAICSVFFSWKFANDTV